MENSYGKGKYHTFPFGSLNGIGWPMYGTKSSSAVGLDNARICLRDAGSENGAWSLYTIIVRPDCTEEGQQYAHNCSQHKAKDMLPGGVHGSDVHDVGVHVDVG
jgi:hypothetical protein